MIFINAITWTVHHCVTALREWLKFSVLGYTRLRIQRNAVDSLQTRLAIATKTHIL